MYEKPHQKTIHLSTPTIYSVGKPHQKTIHLSNPTIYSVGKSPSKDNPSLHPNNIFCRKTPNDKGINISMVRYIFYDVYVV
jgi:hypothetical protein